MGDFRTSLEDALSSLQLEVPDAHRHLVHSLRGHVVRIDVEGCVVAISVEGRALNLHSSDDATVECITDRIAIVRLADGEVTLEQAIWDNEVHLRGNVEELLAFYQALMIFLHGAVRSPAAPAQLARFRTA